MRSISTICVLLGLETTREYDNGSSCFFFRDDNRRLTMVSTFNYLTLAFLYFSAKGKVIMRVMSAARDSAAIGRYS